MSNPEKPGNGSLKPVKIAIHDLESTIIVEKDEILYCKAEGNYTRIYTIDREYVVTKVLRYIESLLPPDIFLRIHKSFIVNKNHILKIKHKNKLIIRSCTELPIARRRRCRILQKLNTDNIII